MRLFSADAPFCKPNQTKVYGIAKNEVVNITCEVEANPTDLHFRWKFNNSVESEDLRSELVNKSGTTISVITHMPVLEVDYGTLLCSATNKVGHQRIPCVFHVIAAGNLHALRYHFVILLYYYRRIIQGTYCITTYGLVIAKKKLRALY